MKTPPLGARSGLASLLILALFLGLLHHAV